MSIISFMVNRLFTSGDNKRDAGLGTPPEIERFDDLIYGPDPTWQTLDVYRPKNAEGKLPVIVSVHGGGWVYGDKKRYQYYCMDLAGRGFAVVNFTYRLAPKFKYPSPLEDTCLVFRWVRNNAEKYGLDLNNLFAVGDSAGGHLLALYCAAQINPEYAASYDFPVLGHDLPKAVGLNCGAYEVSTEGFLGQLMKDLLPKKGTEEELIMVSPLKHLNASFPPSYIMTAVKDFLQEDAGKMRDLLESLGVEHEYHYYDDEAHSLGHVFHLNIRSTQAIECNDDECRFFREHMGV